MATDQALIGKILIAFVAGAMVAAVAAAALWPHSGNSTDQATARVATSSPGHAERAPLPAKNDHITPDFCRAMGVYARSIMESRQKNVPMADVMDLAVKADPGISPVLQQMVVDAYERPRMSAEGNQDRFVRDFENDSYLACTRASR